MQNEMKDSGIEWIKKIPKTWDITILSALFSERKCKNTGMIEHNLLSLSYGNVVRKSIETKEGLLPASFENYNIVEPGNIVFRLTDLQNDKRSLRTGLCKERGIITSAYVTLQIRSNDSARYMHYLFHAYDLCKVFYGMGDGVRQGMNYEDLKRLRILRPDQETQCRIADYLDHKCNQIDTIIVRQQEVIEKLKAYRLSVISEAVTKGLDPNVPMKDSGVEWIGKIPEHWILNKLKYLSLDIGDGIHATPTYDVEGKVYFVNGNNIGDDYLVFKEDTNTISETELALYKLPLLTENTVFITLNGATYGKTSFYHGEKVLLGKSAGFITLKPNENKEFVRYYLQSYTAKLIMDLSLLGSTIANLSLRTLRDFMIPYPPIEEQMQIVHYLNNKTSSIDAAIFKKKKIIDKLIDYKKSLIYEVVTGKKAV